MEKKYCDICKDAVEGVSGGTLYVPTTFLSKRYDLCKKCATKLHKTVKKMIKQRKNK